MEKPKILSEEEITSEAVKVKGLYYTGGMAYLERLVGFGRLMIRRQLDADVAYYEPLIQQAKAEVAREMDMLLCVLIRNVALKDVEAATLLTSQLTSIMDLLKSKYTGGQK